MVGSELSQHHACAFFLFSKLIYPFIHSLYIPISALLPISYFPFGERFKYPLWIVVWLSCTLWLIPSYKWIHTMHYFWVWVTSLRIIFLVLTICLPNFFLNPFIICTTEEYRCLWVNFVFSDKYFGHIYTYIPIICG